MLGSDIAVALPTLRAEAESRMTLTVRVESVAVAPDADTGADVEAATVSHLALPCRLKPGRLQPRGASVQGSTVTETSPEMHFPWDASGLRVGHRAVVTAVGPLDSPMLVGRAYRLTGPSEGSQMTAQRWGVETWAELMS